MDSSAWLGYFSGNQRADTEITGECGLELRAELRRELADSLARFQLGEASGGRIVQEVEGARDPALDPASRRAIQLYVLEEGRHARELYVLVRALGGQALTKHWTSDWFRRVRRCLGLRTKLLTMAAAEVVGIVYYSFLHDRVACSELRRTLALIAREEGRHLDFQAAFFGRALACTPAFWRPWQIFSIGLRFTLISCAALLAMGLDHRKLLALLDVRASDFVAECLHALGSRRELLRNTIETSITGECDRTVPIPR